MSRFPVCALLVALLGAVSPAHADIPRLRHVLIISVDGLRSDALLRARAPVIRDLMARGSFSMWAMTVPMALTLPSHTSMLTGVPVATHRIDWNGQPPANRDPNPQRPTLFEIAKAAGFSTALAAGKSKFVALLKRGTLDRSYVPRKGEDVSDAAVTDTVVAWIAHRAPEVLFVHLPDVDGAGHSLGWGSDPQLEAIAGADSCIGRLLAALERRRLRDSTLVIVSADHGGAGLSHGANDGRSLYIPWIVAGPQVRRNFDLTSVSNLNIHTEDTFATACAVLGLEPKQPVEGRAVTAAFDVPGH
jgi:predicted AlkP superfamily pyrophosphatase or phosphodiesterase